MSLDEVLVEKSSFSFQCWDLKITEAMNLSDLCMEMKAKTILRLQTPEIT